MATRKEIRTHRIAGVYEPVEYTVTTEFCVECGATDLATVGKYLPETVQAVLVCTTLALFLASVISALLMTSLMVCGGLGVLSLLVFVAFGALTQFVERHNYPRGRQCGNEDVT